MNFEFYYYFYINIVAIKNIITIIVKRYIIVFKNIIINIANIANVANVVNVVNIANIALG